jgi:hypothetical protein
VIAAKQKRAILFDTLEADGIAVNFHLKHENADGDKMYSDVAKDIRAAWIAARYGKDGSTLWAAYEADPTSLTKAQKKKRKAMSQQLGTNMAKLAKQYAAHLEDDDDKPKSTFTSRLLKAFATAKDRLEKYDPKRPTGRTLPSSTLWRCHGAGQCYRSRRNRGRLRDRIITLTQGRRWCRPYFFGGRT